jgi:hypothetical protein
MGTPEYCFQRWIYKIYLKIGLKLFENIISCRPRFVGPNIVLQLDVVVVTVGMFWRFSIFFSVLIFQQSAGREGTGCHARL